MNSKPILFILVVLRVKSRNRRGGVICDYLRKIRNYYLTLTSNDSRIMMNNYVGRVNNVKRG